MSFENTIIMTERDKENHMHAPATRRKHGPPLLVQTIRHYYGEQMYGVVWERETESFTSYGQRQI